MNTHFAHAETATHIHAGNEQSAAIYVGLFTVGILVTGLLIAWLLSKNRKDNTTEKAE